MLLKNGKFQNVPYSPSCLEKAKGKLGDEAGASVKTLPLCFRIGMHLVFTLVSEQNLFNYLKFLDLFCCFSFNSVSAACSLKVSRVCL